MLALLPILAWAGSTAATASCNAKTFKNAQPKILGVEIVEILAEEVKDWNEYATSPPTLPPLPAEQKPIDFCKVTTFYTHPGLNDTIRVATWMPLTDKAWNGRFLGQGGGGWAAGGEGALSQAVSMGFAAADTDAGHNYFGHPNDVALSSKDWSLTSPGNVNLIALQNFAYRALDELPRIGKSITETYYKKSINYSYWHGCSTGGRQGLVSAQRYPSHYNGILSAAPAINWVTFLVTEYYAHVKMRELNYYPPPCELNAITQAAIGACDELDGVKDGVVSAYHKCHFDPLSVVGQQYSCEGDSRKITKEAAQIAATTWSGPMKDGKPIWSGLAQEAYLPGIDPLFGGLAETTCASGNKNCASKPFAISADWIKHFLLKDPAADLSTMDEELFHRLLRISRQEYHSMMDSADPDLAPFQAAGGKIVHWHGLADQLIPPNGSLNYFERVQAAVGEDTRDWYRYFEVPGIAHCLGGDGAFPATAIHSLMEWVEEGRAPESLLGTKMPAFSSDPTSEVFERKHCAWPKVARFTGGDSTKAENFECAEDFGRVGGGHDEL